MGTQSRNQLTAWGAQACGRGFPSVGGPILQNEEGWVGGAIIERRVRVDPAAQRVRHSLARAGPLHLGKKLLLHRVEQVGAEIARVQQDLVLQGDLRGKWWDGLRPGKAPQKDGA